MKEKQNLTISRLLELQRRARRIGTFTSFGRAAENKKLLCLAEKKLAAIDRELKKGGDFQ